MTRRDDRNNLQLRTLAAHALSLSVVLFVIGWMGATVHPSARATAAYSAAAPRNAPAAPASLPDTPALTLTGETTASLFGQSVATAGDVNGDGYADLIVGANNYNSAQGRAYLFLGSSSGLAGTPVLTLTGEALFNLFGVSVAGAGDVNGDGFADVIIGASYYNEGQGRAYVYLGSASGLAASPALTLTGEISSGLGTSVATAGDVNGDGYADVLLGASGYNSAQGRAYLHLGSASGLSAAPALTLSGETTSTAFGGRVATAGDVNGDGYADFIVGAHRYNDYQGRAYLYLGGAGTLSATPVLTLTGEASNNRFGQSVGTAGDVNGDGYADLIVGAPSPGSQVGRAYLYLGGAGVPSTTPALTLTGETIGDRFGYAIASAGDVDGDGYADVLAGAYSYNTGQGRAYLHLGSAGGLSAAPVLTFTGEGTFNWLGVAVGTAGDVNADGAADFVVGASGYNGSQGRVYVYHGTVRLPYKLFLPAIRR